MPPEFRNDFWYDLFDDVMRRSSSTFYSMMPLLCIVFMNQVDRSNGKLIDFLSVIVLDICKVFD